MFAEESGRKLCIVGHIDPEKKVDITADLVLGGEKKNLLHGALFLQDNLVKTDYGTSKDNFNYFLVSNDYKYSYTRWPRDQCASACDRRS
jgi:hypothetical protein